MIKVHSLFVTSVAFGLLSACAPEADQSATATAAAGQALAAHVKPPERIQAGARLVALGATDDGQALYWDNGVVYATALRPGAPRRFVAAASLPPLTMIVGRVAMVWTAQDYFGPTVTSPLVVWTAKQGPKTVSNASLPPSFGALQAVTAVSPDHREIIFVTNVSAGGTVGDIVRADVDGQRPTTLVQGADVNPAGTCPPHAGFNRKSHNGSQSQIDEADGDDAESADGDDAESADAPDAPPGARGDRPSSRPNDLITLASACQAGATVATLAAWAGGAKTVLSTNVRAGRPWVTDGAGRHLLAQLADNTPLVFDLAAGTSLVSETSPIIRGWMNPDGNVFTIAQAGPTGRELHRTTFSPAPRTEVVMPLPLGMNFRFSNHLAQGLPYYNVSPVPTSPDGELLVGFNTADPATGIPDGFFVNVSRANHTPVQFETKPIVIMSFENATRDSRYVLYYTFDATTGLDGLSAASRDGASRQISVGNTMFVHYGLEGSKIAYSDARVGDPADLFATTDLKSVDLGSAQLSPRLIAPQAYNLFFPTSKRRSMIYTSDADPSAQGLYLARVH